MRRLQVGFTLGVLVFVASLGSVCSVSAQTPPERQVVVPAGPSSIHVVVRGRGEPILLIPSRGRGVEDFDDLSRRLAQAGYEVILPQPRGIGASTGPLDSLTYHDLASDVAATIRSVTGGRPVTVIGHAFGNRVARSVASDNPTLVKQLVLLAAGGMVPPSPAVAQVNNIIFNPASSPARRVEGLRQTFFGKTSDAETWRSGWYLDAAAAQRAADPRSPVREWWSGGVAPILVLQGTEDVSAPRENAERLAMEFPQRVTIVDVTGSGHAMLPEQPVQVATAILKFLTR